MDMYTHGIIVIRYLKHSLVYAFIDVFFLRLLVQLLCSLWLCLWVTICLVSMKSQYLPTTISYDYIWKCVCVLEGRWSCIVNSNIIHGCSLVPRPYPALFGGEPGYDAI